MGFDQVMGAQVRSVEDTMHEGLAARVVRGGRVYKTDIDNLWDAATDAKRIALWFAPVAGSFKPGGHYQIEGNASGTITRCDSPKALDLTWEMGGNISWVKLRLHAKPGGTELILDHIMAKDEASEAHWAQYGPGATGIGWDLSFWGLAEHVDSGGPVDQDAAMAWMGTPDGKAFIRACAEAWGQAHIACGENAKTAREMAQNTGNFYTGE